MPLPVIANVFRVAINWRESVTGQVATNVIHVSAPSLTAAQVADRVAAAPGGVMVDCAVATAVVEEFVVTPLDGSSASHTLPYTGTHWKGFQSGDFVPQAAVVVSFRTGQRGRSNRGRVFLPFTGEAVVSNGSISSSTANDQAAAWQDLIDTQFPANGMSLVVASYKLAQSHLVETASCLTAIGTQRRRQTRVRYP